jgi:hypothetical protein
MAKITTTIIELFLVGVLGPIALQAIATMNVTGVNSTVVIIFQVLVPILAGLAIALKWLGKL